MANTLDISPISYTNKDFRAIYEELLDLINDLTDRWDPKSTNESDPGLVLVKLKAFLADKLNYNIDKNILETFPSQATQRGNAQKLYDILGYGMKYYQSATTSVVMRYNKGSNPGVYSASNKGAYTIPAFTQLTDTNNSVSYVTKFDAQISIESGNQSSIEVEVLEGYVQDFSINGETTIQVSNLDSDYRLYFTESMIAQNGIFINSDKDSTYWTAVDNLESTQLGQKVFKFGLMPVTNTCYLEFPQDAANLFGDGIHIKYIVTQGVDGNISANVLNSISNTLELDDIKELDSDGNRTDTKADLKNYTLVIQNKSAVSGKNPESLKQAYRNCQKVIDTFNTLVTIQDYQNSIYNSGVVSNVVVSDRTNDINKSYRVVNKSVDGDRILNLNSRKDSGTFTPAMSAFDIGIYALVNVANVSDADSYNRSFQTSQNSIELAKEAIENYKSIQHDYIDTIKDSSSRPFIFKNMVSLEGKVLTYQKVTVKEAESIQDKIKNHLYNVYQSRNMDFGKELDYNDLLDEIKNADDRIKTVILEYPEYHLYYMDSNNQKHLLEVETKETKDIRDNIIAKSVLAGVTPYFIFNNNQGLNYSMAPVGTYEGGDYDNEYGYVKVGKISDSVQTPKYEKVAAITTSVKIGDTELSTGFPYTIRENENVFCVGPSYVEKAQLSTCLYYAFLSNSKDATTDKFITYYKVNYYKKSTDSNGNISFTSISKDAYGSLNSSERKSTKAEITKAEYDTLKAALDSTSNSTYSVEEESTDSKTIKANSYYTLGKDEYLIAAEGLDSNKYLDLSGSKNYWIYSGNDKDNNVVSPTMDIKSQSYNPFNSVSKLEVSTTNNLGTSNTISILGENKIQINSNNKIIYAAWSLDNLYNNLFEINDSSSESGMSESDDLYFITENGYSKNKPAVTLGYALKKILQNNDLFIYTDENKYDLVLLGSGTEIVVESSSFNSLKSQFKNIKNKPWSMISVDSSALSSDGLNSSVEWQTIPVSLKLYTAEKQIISLGEGVTIDLSDSNSEKSISNNPIDIDQSNYFSYKYEGEDQYTELPSITGGKWQVFSRLNLIISPTQGQLLKNGQGVILYTVDDSQWANNDILKYDKSGTLGPTQYITSNSIVALSGGHQQNSAVLENSGDLKVSLELYVSGQKDGASDNFGAIKAGLSGTGDQAKIFEDSAGINQYSDFTKIIFSLPNETTTYTGKLSLKLSSQFKNSLIPVLFQSTSDGCKCTLESPSTYFIADTTNIINGFGNKYLKYIYITDSNYGNGELTLDIVIQGIASLNIYNPLKIDKKNSLIENNANIEDILITLASQGIGQNVFDYSYQIDEEDQILNPLDPESFFLTNHPFNRWVISQLNTETNISTNEPYLNIKVSKQSYQTTTR